jgi:Ca-activated chloride channel family protein
MVRALCLALPLAMISAGQVAIEPRKAPAKQEPRTQPTLRIDTSLVLVPVAVNDPLNRPVNGLEKEHFRIFDNKIEQKITQFAMDDEPVAVGLIFDTSYSMGGKLRRSRMAAAEFFRLSNPEDEFFLVEFSDNARLVVPLTSDYGTIANQLTFSKAKGSTALFDAVYLGLNELRRSKKRKKALLLISDGGDNNSRYSQREIEKVVRESDVLIYSIGIFASNGSIEDPWLLTRISEQTGARMFEADARELPDIAQKIGIELRNRYVIGYSPTSQERDGKYHTVEVRVVPPRGLPKLKAHWRQGYFAPQD